MRGDGPVTDLRAPWRELCTFVQGSAGRRHRRWTASPEGRAHIEVRGIEAPARGSLRAEVKAAIERLDGVDWAEVNAVIGRAVVVFDPASLSADDLIAAVEEVERSHKVHDERFSDRDHPADAEPILRNIFGLVADIGGLGFATAAQVVHLVPIPAEVPGLVSLVDAQPRVRQLLEHRLGRSVTDFSFATADALAQAIGQGPLGLVVDIAHRTNMLSEQRARRAVWDRREAALVADREAASHDAVKLVPRPVPLPGGPIERYTDLAAVGSLGAFGVVLGVTRNPRRASTLLLAGIPKAASMGRDAFAAQLGSRLADDGVLAMDPAALRRLDRVDTLVLDERIASSGQWSIDEIVPLADDADISECAARARSLFDASDPLRVSSRTSWVLAPLEAG